MTTAAADLFGVVAYPSIFDLDRALEQGKKATTGALGTGLVVTLDNTNGLWATAATASTGRAGVIPKLYQGKDVNTASSAEVVVLTGIGAEVYAEAGDTIKPGAKVTFGATGTVIPQTSTYPVIGHYVGHYGEGSGAGEPPTDGTVGQAVRIRLGGSA